MPQLQVAGIKGRDDELRVGLESADNSAATSAAPAQAFVGATSATIPQLHTELVEYSDGMDGGFLGPDFSPAEIEEQLRAFGAVYRRPTREDLLDTVARLLAEEQVVGWFNARMEFGPRALGARSILGDPRSPRMQSQMNLKIKFRESFRPFAPSVLQERAREYFDLESESPYMMLVAPVTQSRRVPEAVDDQRLSGLAKLNVPRSEIPAVTHVDYSARIQTVSRNTNPNYYDLIRKFEEHTGCAVLVNTSFNVRGEPIVCTPADAYRCFMRTRIDYLVCWPFLLSKEDQPEWEEAEAWSETFQLD